MKREIVLTIKDGAGTANTYTINFPTAGQLLTIENLKNSLTPYYTEMASKGTILSQIALDIVDMQAYFSILCPQILKDLKAPLMDLDLMDLTQLRTQYDKVFAPWWTEWIKKLQQIPQDSNSSGKQSTQTGGEQQLDPEKNIDLGGGSKG